MEVEKPKGEALITDFSEKSEIDDKKAAEMEKKRLAMKKKMEDQAAERKRKAEEKKAQKETKNEGEKNEETPKENSKITKPEAIVVEIPNEIPQGGMSAAEKKQQQMKKRMEDRQKELEKKKQERLAKKNGEKPEEKTPKKTVKKPKETPKEDPIDKEDAKLAIPPWVDDSDDIPIPSKGYDLSNLDQIDPFGSKPIGGAKKVDEAICGGGGGYDLSKLDSADPFGTGAGMGGGADPFGGGGEPPKELSDKGTFFLIFQN